VDKVNVVTLASPTPTWENVLDMMYGPESQNVRTDGTAAWLLSPASKMALRLLPKSATQATNGYLYEADRDEIAGVRAIATQQLGSGAHADKLVYSPKWSDLCIFLAPSIGVTVNPFTLAAQGATLVVVDVLVGVATKHPCAFCVSSNAVA
jgi:hypothetical protein